MNQKLLAVLRTIGIIVFFGACNALLTYFGTVPWLGGSIAFLATAYGASLEHQLAVKWGYNLTPTQAAAVGSIK